MAWFRKPKYTTLSPPERKIDVPEGLWVKCSKCGHLNYRKKWEENLYVCLKCNYHSRISARERIKIFADVGTFIEYDADIQSADVLGFKDVKPYSQRISEAQTKTGLKSAVVCGKCKLNGKIINLAVMDFEFMGGSMGSAVGEKITRTVERSIKSSIPLVIFSSSGGARMQEGVISLMQMAKTSAAIAELMQYRIPYISVLTDPTTGGVSASFAFLGDIILAEPGALIGFAGPRVIEQTIKQKLPSGFQTSEFLLEHGMIDMVVPRKELREKVSLILDHLL
jgi:acetyl-CoA carboxylase carboxyl transferase subunit beta